MRGLTVRLMYRNRVEVKEVRIQLISDHPYMDDSKFQF
jgi:hypothetical protein